MIRSIVHFALGTLVGVSIAGCSGSTSSSTPDNGVAMTTVQCTVGMPACQTEQAHVPAAGEINRTVVPTWVQREGNATYVYYHLHSDDTDLYLYFAPTLPGTFSSEEARAAFTYALLQFQVEPPSESGTLTLLGLGDNLQLGDFERFEVVNGALSWRLALTGGYSRHLVNATNADASNGDPRWCSTGDISGTCSCGCAGPPLHVTLEGTVAE